ncbi:MULTISPECIES: arginine deiminase [unclassified Sporolactobacillus]|uniref:arginine deiminase n=1 Tax=unclassified Sporolactobacillus TaxID=2628533 RepID=UPI002368EABC|nr:arginine deiminase [Sporolactobacillus sp. CQH2019]MDD9148909.1 arginine deiminase [Sporolactobacillus sp. CQH2019]
MKYPVHVTSEIGELKTVMLHRPGKEVENLTPEILQRLLFDDIPYLPSVQKEHDFFATALRNQGVEVLYLDKLMAEALHTKDIREKFVSQILRESNLCVDEFSQILSDYLLSLPNMDLVHKVMAGILKKEVVKAQPTHLYEMTESHYPFYLDPMPNLYFTRDPSAIIGDGITINRMKEKARRRESIFIEYIFRYHPRFSEYQIPIWTDRNFEFSMEGGDELIISPETVCIGISSRTTARAIERLAHQLFANQDKVKQIIAVEIPKLRSFMHLDTVFTMVDRDKFTIHPAALGAEGEMNLFVIEKGDEKGGLKITRRTSLVNTLKEALKLQEIDFIPCGGGDEIASAREQWNDGSNTLAIAPGVVVTYDRNYVSNEILREHGIEVIEVPSSELSRGRGGPRCMSMPLYREDI